MKGLLTHTSESIKPGFNITPKAFNSVNMTFTMGELILSMVDPKTTMPIKKVIRYFQVERKLDETLNAIFSIQIPMIDN